MLQTIKHIILYVVGDRGPPGQQGKFGPPGMPGGTGSSGDHVNITSGAVYVRWGRTSCPADVQLLYKGKTGFDMGFEESHYRYFITSPGHRQFGLYADVIKHGVWVQFPTAATFLRITMWL